MVGEENLQRAQAYHPLEHYDAIGTENDSDEITDPDEIHRRDLQAAAARIEAADTDSEASEKNDAG